MDIIDPRLAPGRITFVNSVHRTALNNHFAVHKMAVGYVDLEVSGVTYGEMKTFASFVKGASRQLPNISIRCQESYNNELTQMNLAFPNLQTLIGALFRTNTTFILRNIASADTDKNGTLVFGFLHKDIRPSLTSMVNDYDPLLTNQL